MLMPSTVTNARSYKYYNGAYVESDSPHYNTISNYRIYNNVIPYDQLALIGNSSDKGFTLMEDILEENKQNYTSEYHTLNEFRDSLRSLNSPYDTNTTHGVMFTIDEAKKNYELTLIGRRFEEGFTPFNPNNQRPTYDFYNYIGYDTPIANYASLLFENIAAPVKINVAYTGRSNYEYRTSDLPTVMDQVFPIFIVIIYTLPYMYLLQRAVEEKQTKSRESMRMMGMNDSAYWTSWFIVFFLQCLAISIIMTLGSAFTMFKGSNPLLIFLMYFLYGMSLFGIGLIMIAIFATVRTVALGGIVLMLVAYYLRYAITENTPTGLRLLVSLFPQLNLFNLNYGLWQLQAFSSIGFSEVGTEFRNYSLAWYYLMTVVSFFFWLALGLYITYIIPTEFGTRRHPCFCLMWKKKKPRTVGGRPEKQSLLIQQDSLDTDSEMDLNRRNFERVGNDLSDLEHTNQCLKIDNLSKVYDNGFKAVNHLSLTMYAGQIFALLGHNGAGKTTTISMLTGLFSATSGRAEAFGVDLLEDQEQARTMMGVCPQHNVLFPALTPFEHFDIFCDFKGVPQEQRLQAIEKALGDVDLKGQRDMLCKNLSGGQQRKVSVGIAMLGDSKIVLLDEPTSGMDPTARRRLWDLLKNNKDGKIIILTTHYMEEADILGDRIAIMANGDAQCCGSSMFLKKRFGVGYNLTIDKTTQHKAPQIDNFITARIPGAIKLSEVSSEITYQLPNAAVGRFKEFFLEIDENRAELEIKSYGIGVTTLEEVFLKVGEGIMEKQDVRSASINAAREEQQNDEYCLVDQSVKGMSLRMLQLVSMIKMRLKMTMRGYKVLFLEIFYPTVLIVVSACILAITSAPNERVYALSQSYVPAPQTVMYTYNKDNINNPTLVDNLMNRFYSQNPYKIQSVDIDIRGNNLTTELIQFDDYIMEHSKRGENYFSVYVRDIQTNPLTYDVVTLIDTTQNDAYGYAIQNMITSIARDVKNDNTINFKISRGPFPRSQLVANILNIVLTMITVVSYSIAIGIITSSIAGNICKERTDSIKHQQIVSGGSKLSYWTGIYIVDLIKFIFPGMSFIIIIFAFAINIPLFWLFDILCIISVLPFTYFITFVIQKESVARNVVRMVHIFLGGVMAPVVFSLKLSDKTKVIGIILSWVLKFNPTFTFANGLSALILNPTVNAIDPSKPTSPWDYMGIADAGGDLLFMSIQPFVYVILIILIENKFFRNKIGHAVRMGDYNPINNIDPEINSRSSMILDDDVKDEETRIANLSPDELEVRAYMLNKIYKDRTNTRHAVKDVSFGISFGE